MEIASIQGEKREPAGRHACERLRRRGLVPGVVYGHNRPPETVAVSRHDLMLALEHLQHVIRLEIGGKRKQYLIKDVQYDHLQKEPIHVDLMRVSLKERVHVKVALELKGEPRGTHEGGVLVQLISDLDVECPLTAIPEVLYQNVKELGLAEALHVKDLELPPNLKPVPGPDEIVAIVRPRRGVSVAAAEEEEAVKEASAGPEVIGKGPQETEAEGGE